MMQGAAANAKQQPVSYYSSANVDDDDDDQMSAMEDEIEDTSLVPLETVAWGRESIEIN
jgi:hypothetical protein